MEYKIVLMYHDVVNELHPKSGFQKVGALQYTLNSRVFFEQVTRFNGDYIVFSFDDGGESFYTVIAPILEHNNQKGIFFISSKYIGTEYFLTKEQIKELDKRGHLIASHSHTHPLIISELSYNEIVNEWKTSKTLLEEIVGHEVTVASVPGGAVSKDVIKAAAEVGIKTLYTSEPTTEVRIEYGIEVIGRFTVSKDITMEFFDKIVSDKNYRVQLQKRYKRLLLVKKFLGSNYNRFKQLVLKLRG